MSSQGTFQFSPRWKEEVVGSLDGRSFSIELSMGSACHAYLPTQERWEAAAPDWAKGIWEKVRSDIEAWCESQRYPLTIAANCWVSFDPAT